MKDKRRKKEERRQYSKTLKERSRKHCVITRFVEHGSVILLAVCPSYSCRLGASHLTTFHLTTVPFTLRLTTYCKWQCCWWLRCDRPHCDWPRVANGHVAIDRIAIDHIVIDHVVIDANEYIIFFFCKKGKLFIDIPGWVRLRAY